MIIRFLRLSLIFLAAVGLLVAACREASVEQPSREELQAVAPTPISRPASFVTSNLTIIPTEGEVGAPIAIEILVTNTGELSGTYEVSLKIDGVLEATENVTLAGGASKRISFQVNKPTAKTYLITVDSLGGQFTVKEQPKLLPIVAPISPPPPPPPKGRIVYVAEGGLTMSTGGESFPIRWSVIEVINANGSEKKALTKGATTAEINEVVSIGV